MESALFEKLKESAREGQLELDVRGSCMRPHVLDGDVVTIKSKRTYWPGDIVGAWHELDSRVRVHRFLGYRLTRKGKLLVLSKPDDQVRTDLWVGYEYLLGAVTHVNGVELHRVEPRTRVEAVSFYIKVLGRGLRRRFNGLIS